MVFDIESIDANDLAWASGLMEGEAFIGVVKNSKGRKGLSAKIVVQMNDLDILEKLQKIFGIGAIYYRKPRGNSKESWAWTVYRQSDVRDIIHSIQGWLGKRRFNQCDKVLDYLDD